MEVVVLGYLLGKRTRSVRPHQPLGNSTKFINQPFVASFHGPAHRETFYASANVIYFLQFLDRNLTDDETAAWVRNDEAFPLQQAGSFTDGCPADAELAGQSGLYDAFAGPERAADDGMAQAIANFVRQTRAVSARTQCPH